MSKSSHPIIDQLTTMEAETFTLRWILNGIPVMFDNDILAYIEWKSTLGKSIEIDAESVYVVGSGLLGVSLNPNNSFSLFTESSDVDIAVVSEFHFQHCWRTIRRLGNRYHDLSPKQKQAIEDHRKRLIYWGTIATDKIIGLMPFGVHWLRACTRFSAGSPINNREIKIRVYRDVDSLIAYQTLGVKSAQRRLLSPDLDQISDIPFTEKI